MRRILGVLAGLLLLAACGQKLPAEHVPSQPVVSEGENRSPDGCFLVRMADAGLAGSVQITSAESGEVLWEGEGVDVRSLLWSPEGDFVALARSGQTRCGITVLETENWTSWDFAFPDGSPISEDLFFPENAPWGWWEWENALVFTLTGDGREDLHYLCAFSAARGVIEGTVWREYWETLPGLYDFDRDGRPERLELIRMYEGGGKYSTGGYGLRLWSEAGELLWSETAHESHTGWRSFFACRVEGEDYLLCYEPVMYQGFANYQYRLFSLDEHGGLCAKQERNTDFDINFGSPMHESFDPAAIASFLEEVRGLLADSDLLLTTEGGTFRSGGPGAAFQDDLNIWTEDPLYDAEKSLEKNIHSLGAYWQEMQGSG
ncbi:MAG: hypothetical protein HFG00_04845 [Oscillibacter sp.]|nr:hypothetical protein [Oscillibacter sp.]